MVFKEFAFFSEFAKALDFTGKQNIWVKTGKFEGRKRSGFDLNQPCIGRQKTQPEVSQGRVTNTQFYHHEHSWTCANSPSRYPSFVATNMAASLSVTPSPSPSTPWYESQAINMYCERDMTWFVVKSKWYLAWHLKMWTCQRCAWTLTVQRETTSQTTAERCFQPRRFDLHLLELHESSRSKSSVNSCHPSQSV